MKLEIKDLQIIFGHLDNFIKRKVYLALILMTISSMIEFVSIGSIIPLISSFIVGENTPNLIENFNKIIFIKDRNTIIFVFVLFVVLSAFFRAIVYKFNQTTSALLTSNIGEKIFKNIINLSLLDFKSLNQKKLYTVLNEKLLNFNQVIDRIFIFISGLIVSLGIIFFIFWLNFKIALILITIFISLYLIISIYTKKLLFKNSEKISLSLDKKIQIIQNSLGSFRNILLEKTQSNYLKSFFKEDLNFRLSRVKNSTISTVPRFFMEASGITILLAVTYIFFNYQDNRIDNVEFIIILTAFAFSAQKLLPILQTAYLAWTFIGGNKHIISELKDHLVRNKKDDAKLNTEILTINKNKLNLYRHKNLILRDINFEFNKKVIFKDFTCSIEINKTNVISGPSGSGKTTLVDLICGFYEPLKGKIFLDNLELNKDNFFQFQNEISYVSQDLYLNDKNIIFNICQKNKRDLTINELDKLNEIMSILDFKKINESINIEDDTLPISQILSGGQKQKVALARALFKGKELIILDEATNAMDYDMEDKIYNIFKKNLINVTLIVITHRKDKLNFFDNTISLN